MSRAEIQARELFSSLHLKSIDEEVKRHLMILLLTYPTPESKTKAGVHRFAGAWKGEESADDIIYSIKADRTSNREFEL